MHCEYDAHEHGVKVDCHPTPAFVMPFITQMVKFCYRTEMNDDALSRMSRASLELAPV